MSRGAILLLIIAGVLWAQPPGAWVAAQPQPIPGDYRNRTVTGSVVAVKPESLTIRDADGKEFAFIPSPTLADGGSLTRNSRYSYRWNDVRAGDKLDLITSRRAGVLTCDEICIMRRPGGLVPPVPGENPDSPTAWHANANAAQAKEEGREVPKPPAKKSHITVQWSRFLPAGVFTPPIAPMPREVKPRPATTP